MFFYPFFSSQSQSGRVDAYGSHDVSTGDSYEVTVESMLPGPKLICVNGYGLGEGTTEIYATAVVVEGSGVSILWAFDSNTGTLKGNAGDVMVDDEEKTITFYLYPDLPGSDYSGYNISYILFSFPVGDGGTN